MKITRINRDRGSAAAGKVGLTESDVRIFNEQGIANEIPIGMPGRHRHVFIR
jgi:hypothetical protein